MKICVVGNGKMATAIVSGLIKNKYEVDVVARNEDKLDDIKKRYPLVSISSIKDYDFKDKTVIFALKPYALTEVSQDMKGKIKLFISVLAGVSIEELQNNIKADKYVRAMPNIAATFGLSMTAIHSTTNLREEASKVCSSFGDVLWLEKENDINIATAIAGSGPAMLAQVAEAIIDAGVMNGLKRGDSTILTKGLFKSFFVLLNNKHPALIKEEVMSPNGTTAAGVKSLESDGVRDSFITAISKAYEKSVK